MADIDFAPIEIQRARLGLSSPTPEEKEAIWRNVTIAQTNIRKETGGYRPFRITAQAHNHPSRTRLVAGGIRGSKSQSLALEVVAWLLHSDLIWLVGLTYDDAKQEFEYIAEAALSLGWVARLSWGQNKYQPCVLETNWGTIVETKSASDPSSLMSRAPDFIGMCEPGKMDIIAYRRCVERLTTRRGLLYMAGTFENTAPWMEQLWKEWKRWPNKDNAKSFSSPTYTNTVVYPKGVKDLEYQRLKEVTLTAQDPGQESAGWDDFLRRIVGVPASSPEIIFSKIFKPREHVKNVEYIEWSGKTDRQGQRTHMPVFGAMDPGWSGNSRYVCLAIQVDEEHKQIRVFDEIVRQLHTHEEMKREVAKQEWWPHMHSATMDPYAGESHALGSYAPADYWRKNDQFGPVEVVLPARMKHTEDEIRLVQNYFTGINGWTIVISTRCERLRYELATWRRKKIRDVIGDPEKKNNDCVKALIYFLTHHQNGQVGLMITRQREMISPYSLTGAGVDPIMGWERTEAELSNERSIWGAEAEEGGWLSS